MTIEWRDTCSDYRHQFQLQVPNRECDETIRVCRWVPPSRFHRHAAGQVIVLHSRQRTTG